jgi:hypothetical protein
MLIESRKSFLEAHKNQLDELLCSYVYHKRMFGGLFITAFTSMPTKCRLSRLLKRTINPDNNLESPCILFYQIPSVKNLDFNYFKFNPWLLT